MNVSSRTGSTRHDARQPSGFDFTLSMRTLVDDMIHRLPELDHIDLDRVAFSISQTRKAVSHGLYASLTPMRFEGGAITTVRKGQRWGVQKFVSSQGIEILYIVRFYLPRFQNRDLHDKLTTVVHELWHISPQFDGDLRRFEGRCHAHSSSQKQYNSFVSRLAENWLSQDPPSELYEFLCYDFRELVDRFGRVRGTKVRTPKLFPIT